MTTRITLKAVKIVPTDFGYRADLALPKDKGYDAIILCYNRGQGLVPIGLCLPHQVYLQKLESIYEQFGGSYNFEIVAIPICSKDYITVVDNEFDLITRRE